MKPTTQLVVFDLAGTTIRDDGGVLAAFRQALSLSGYEVPDEEILPLMGYRKDEAIRRILHEYEPVKDRIGSRLIGRIHERFRACMLGHYTGVPPVPLPGVPEVFAVLKQQGIRVAVNTGFSADITRAILDHTGWLTGGLVEDAVSSDEVPQGRPHPHMIRLLMERAGLNDPLTVVKVGDTESDIHEGRNAGCRLSIGVTTGAFTRGQLLLHQPSFVIGHMAELLPLLHLSPDAHAPVPAPAATAG